MTKLHGNAVPEEEFRSRILFAIGQLKLEGRQITIAAMREAGMRGRDRRIREGIEALRREGLIPAHVLTGNGSATAVPDPIDELSAADVARLRREAVDREIDVRERSAEWVAEHNARWRRIRRKAWAERRAEG